MDIKLVQGFTGKIWITDQNRKSLFQKEIKSQQELTDFLKQYSDSREGWGVLRCAICPLKTGSFQILVRDVTLPTFINFALNINNFALKIFISLFAILFDAITLPIRIITTPFKIYYDSRNPEQPHPLSKFLEIDSKQQLSDESIFIKYHTEDVTIKDEGMEGTNKLKSGFKKTVDGSVFVSLKQLYTTISQSKEKNTCTSYRGFNEEWVVENDSSISNSKKIISG